jgi:hypothetical protein
VTWLAFIASVIGSLAWPVALVVLALGFRQQITVNLGRLIKAKGFGGELEFTQGLNKAEELAPPVTAKQDALLPLPTQTATATTEDPEKPSYTLRINKNDPPGYRVLSAWKFLSMEISNAALRRGQNRPKLHDPRGLIQTARDLGFSPEEIDQITELRKLRNSAAHSREPISTTDAQRYEDLVLNLLMRLEEIEKRDKP